jgi:hypothetical protein
MGWQHCMICELPIRRKHRAAGSTIENPIHDICLAISQAYIAKEIHAELIKLGWVKTKRPGLYTKGEEIMFVKPLS